MEIVLSNSQTGGSLFLYSIIDPNHRSLVFLYKLISWLSSHIQNAKTVRKTFSRFNPGKPLEDSIQEDRITLVPVQPRRQDNLSTGLTRKTG